MSRMYRAIFFCWVPRHYEGRRVDIVSVPDPPNSWWGWPNLTGWSTIVSASLRAGGEKSVSPEAGELNGIKQDLQKFPPET